MGSRIEPQDEPLSPWLKTLGSNSSQFKDTEDTDLGIRRGSECFLQDQPLPPRVAPWVAPWNLKTSIFTDEEDMDQEIEIEIEDPNPWREPTTVFSAPMLCPSRISKLNDFTPTPYTLSVLTPMLDGKIAYPVDPPGKSIQDSTIAHEPNATTVGSLKTSVCSSFGTESESVTFEPQEWPEELRKHLRKDSAEKTRKESCEDLLKKRPEYRGQHKKRVELPLNILGSTYSTLPDTGSNENIMAKEIALKLHTNIDDTAEYQKEFQVADGNVVKSLGRISISCAFTEEPDVEHFCTFYVFTTLVVPVIMGAAFLHATETLTKHKNRLRTTMAPCNGLSQICTLNNPIQSIRCWANGEAVLASADTGSDLNVVSLAYTKLRGFRVKKPSDTSNLQVQFADGSKAWTVGETTIKMKFAGKSRSLRPAERYTLENPTIKRKFYVLKGLTSDILLGREFLEETDTFETYKSLFTSNTNRRALSQVNTIVWLKTAETYLSRLSSRVSLAVPEPMPGNEPKKTPRKAAF